MTVTQTCSNMDELLDRTFFEPRKNLVKTKHMLNFNFELLDFYWSYVSLLLNLCQSSTEDLPNNVKRRGT